MEKQDLKFNSITSLNPHSLYSPCTQICHGFISFLHLSSFEGHKESITYDAVYSYQSSTKEFTLILLHTSSCNKLMTFTHIGYVKLQPQSCQTYRIQATLQNFCQTFYVKSDTSQEQWSLSFPTRGTGTPGDRRALSRPKCNVNDHWLLYEHYFSITFIFLYFLRNVAIVWRHCNITLCIGITRQKGWEQLH